MKDEEKIGLKTWISKSIMTLLILLAIVYLVEFYMEMPILVDSILAIIIALCIGFTHEALHYRKAVKLGYEPKWYRTKIMMGFEITHHTKRSIWMKHRKQIALAPYVVLVPVSIILIVVGVYYNYLGILIGGIAGVLLHGVSWFFEGKDV